MASAPSFSPWEPNRANFDIDKQKWELYNIDEDFSQTNDLASAQPEKLRALQDLWWVEASKYNVLPLDWRAVERLNAELMGRPSLAGDARVFTYYEGQVGLANEACPRILNKSWSLTADLTIPASGAEGMINTYGGMVGGYGLYVKGGKLHFVYNYLDIDRYVAVSQSALPKGKVQVKVDVKSEGKEGEFGKPATVVMSVNGKNAGAGMLPKTIPLQISLGEGMDVGMDIGSAVDFSYKLPYKFTGKIEKVVIEISNY